mmetsp:Transcript_27156/g.79514  ORF Transcript_27156/g.79514 Transcript_27156/m.79514 type:complete len:211 (-) Transcript_27156:73-705(-)
MGRYGEIWGDMGRYGEISCVIRRPLQPAGDLHADHPAGPRTRAGAQRAGRHPRQALRHPQAGGVDRRAAPALPRHVGACGDAGRAARPDRVHRRPVCRLHGPCRRRAPLRCKVPEARAPKVLLCHRHATDRRRHPAGNHHTKLLMTLAVRQRAPSSPHPSSSERCLVLLAPPLCRPRGVSALCPALWSAGSEPQSRFSLVHVGSALPMYL